MKTVLRAMREPPITPGKEKLVTSGAGIHPG